jgi:hypothetical protein
MNEAPHSEIWQHVESGGLYVVIVNDALIEKTGTTAVVYKSLWDGAVWVRPYSEFYDGRFRNLMIEEVTGTEHDED